MVARFAETMKRVFHIEVKKDNGNYVASDFYHEDMDVFAALFIG